MAEAGGDSEGSSWLRERLCAVSVDLDEIPHYHAIHGLPPPQGAAASAVYDTALPRLLELSKSAQAPLTLFAIGADLARGGNARALASAAAQGHEIGNHSLDHLYDLTRRPEGEMRRQVRGGAYAIERATGRRPSGFRAPGYTVTDALLDVLAAEGVSYDASVFPCPSYYLAKASVMGLLRARGRQSASIVDDPRVLSAPVSPYRVGKPYWTRGQGIREIPIQVTRGPRLPFIGTSLTLGPRPLGGLLTGAVVGAAFVNLELHGIDALGSEDGLSALVGYQPDVRVPHGTKLERLGAALGALRLAGYRMVTLGELAARAIPDRTGARP